MTIEKAIEILQDLLREGPQFPPDDRREAVQLGIEALKTVKDMRNHPFPDGVIELPGETKD